MGESLTFLGYTHKKAASSPVVPPDENSTVVGNPTALLINDPATITVTLIGDFGQLMPNVNVELHVAPTNEGDGATGVTDAFGKLVFDVTSASPGAFVYSAENTDHSVMLAQTATITYTQSSGTEAGNSSVSASPSQTNTGGSSSVTVTLRDAGNAVMPNVNVQLHVSPTSPNDGDTGVTDSAGQHAFSVSSAVAGTFVYSVADTDHSVTVTQTAPVTYVSSGSEAANSSVIASPTTAEIPTTSAITVTLRDASDAVMTGVNVTLHVSPSNPDDGATGITDMAGQCVFTVSSADAGTFVYSATDTDNSVTVTQTATVRFLLAAGGGTMLGWF